MLGIKSLLAILLLEVLIPCLSQANTIRKVEASEDRVALVRTAIGFSTILEFPSKPTSAVLGDQDAFKLEYVGNSITIKPIIPGATSNLFVFTEYHRFNCTLKTGNRAEVDYIVNIVPPESHQGGASSPAHELLLNRSANYDGFQLRAVSVLLPTSLADPRGASVIHFELRSNKKIYAFQPGSIGVKQGGQFITIESLYFDSMELRPNAQAITGKLVILNQDRTGNSNLELVFAVPGKLKKEKPYPLSVNLSPKLSSKGVPRGPF